MLHFLPLTVTSFIQKTSFAPRFQQAFSLAAVLAVSSGFSAVSAAPLMPNTPFDSPSAFNEALTPTEPKILLAGHFLQTRKPSQTWSNLYLAFGVQLASRGQLLSSRPLLERAMLIEPDNADIAFMYGTVLEGLGELDTAEKTYRSVINIDSQSLDAYYKLGMLYDKQENPKKGLTMLVKAIEIAPNEPYIYYDAGVLASKMGQFNHAAKYAKAATELDPSFAEAHNNYGYALANLGKFNEALAAVNKSLALKPDSAASLDTRGFAYQGLKNYEKALADYEKAIELNPNIGEIHLHRAETLEKLNRPVKALHAYEKYMLLEPNASDIKQVKSRVKFLKKNPVVKSALKESSLSIETLTSEESGETTLSTIMP
jgi:tetratricopeptide (TPR) repeat protein